MVIVRFVTPLFIAAPPSQNKPLFFPPPICSRPSSFPTTITRKFRGPPFSDRTFSRPPLSRSFESSSRQIARPLFFSIRATLTSSPLFACSKGPLGLLHSKTFPSIRTFFGTSTRVPPDSSSRSYSFRVAFRGRVSFAASSSNW